MYILQPSNFALGSRPNFLIYFLLLVVLGVSPQVGWAHGICEGQFMSNEGIDRWQRGLNKLDQELIDFWNHEDAWEKQYKVLRGAAFRIQSLGKVYRKLDEDRKIDPAIMEIVKSFDDGLTEGPFDLIRRLGKSLEDSLGAYDMEKELVDVLEDAGASETELSAAKARKEAKRKEIEAYMNEHWKSGNYRRLIQTMLDQNPWLSSKDDREFYGKRVRKRLEKLQGKFEDGAFPVEEVEDGTHELRRQIRYIAMMMQHSDGLFELDKSETLIKAFKHLKDDPVADSMFAKLPSVKVESPIRIPWVIYLAITKYVYELGLAKDSGGFEHQIVTLLTESGLESDHKKAEARAHELVGQSNNLYDRVKIHTGIEEEVLETGIFEKLADYIKQQLK